MKITWDNVDEFVLTKKGHFKRKKQYYILREGKDCCKQCGDPYFVRKDQLDLGNGLYCSRKCRMSGKNNPMYGKTHTDEVKKLLSTNIKKSISTIKKRYGVSNISECDFIKDKKGQIIINFDNVSDYVSKYGYTLIDIDGNNQNAILLLKCNNNHIFTIKWCSFKRGHRCRECFYDSLSIDNNTKTEFEYYKRVVYKYTRKSVRRNKTLYFGKRGEHHLDHKYSIYQGYNENIPPFIIGNKHNLQLLSEKDNLKKGKNCSITKEELYNEYYRET